MELLIQLAAIIVWLLLVLLLEFRYVPNNLSDFELQRRVEAEDPAAKFETKRRWLMAALSGLRVLGAALLLAGLAALLVSTHEWWIGLLLVAGYWLLAQIFVAKGWLSKAAGNLQNRVESLEIGFLYPLTPVFKHLAPKVHTMVAPIVTSREDLADMIERDNRVLTPGEKTGLLASMNFSHLKVRDIMVPRDKVVVVGLSETVGPVLLDHLHKSGHKIYPVVKKDLDHIQGLLYVGDVAQADPEVKTVKDALRPTVHYISANAPLAGLLSASLQSGRQLFIVVDDNGNTQGLATLQDAIVRLLGTAPPDHFYTSTDPKKVKLS